MAHKQLYNCTVEYNNKLTAARTRHKSFCYRITCEVVVDCDSIANGASKIECLKELAPAHLLRGVLRIKARIFTFYPTAHRILKLRCFSSVEYLRKKFLLLFFLFIVHAYLLQAESHRVNLGDLYHHWVVA